MPELRRLEVFDAACQSAFGYLALRMCGDAVVRLAISASRPTLRRHKATAAQAALAAVCSYLDSGSMQGLPPTRLSGTDFQLRVWRLLRQIPRGQIRTYGEIARELASSARAIGGACRANPVLILVPCHRVVSAHGLGGFAGQANGRWTDLKKRLLAAEGVLMR